MNIFLGNPPENIKQWIIEHYTPPTPVLGPLCFTAVGSDMTVKYGNDYNYAGGMKNAGINFQYSTDGQNWTEWVLGETQFDPISIPVGTKLYLRGNNPNGVYSPNGPANECFTFTGSGTINASGNIQSLIDPTMERTDVPENCFKNMFNNCTSLVSAPALPATTLADSCYYNMFYSCSNLAQAPVLPATTLADSCYNGMFWDCSNMTQAPALPATTLADRCYDNMFSGCDKFSDCHMKASMEGVYNTSTHGDTTKTVIYDL